MAKIGFSFSYAASPFKDRGSLRYFAITLTAVVVAGCSLFGQDNRQTIAQATLYDSPAAPAGPAVSKRPDAIFNAALNAKFPVGSNAEGLNAYVHKLGGECRQENDAKTGEMAMHCAIVETATLCIRQSLMIEVNLDAQRVKHLDAYRLLESC